MKRFLATPLLTLLFGALPIVISAQQLETSEVLQASEEPDSLIVHHFDSLVSQHLPKGGNVAIYAYDLSSRKPLYSYQADKLGRPASNMKLLTTITALAQEASDEPFQTEVWAEGSLSLHQDTLYGNLYVIGGMDPEFDDTALDSLVDQVAGQPFTTLCGNLYGDLSLRDSIPYGDGWCWDDTPFNYQPWLSPLLLNKGVVKVTVKPAKEKGAPAEVSVTPASSYYTIENLSQSRTPSAGKLRIDRDWMEQRNHITIRGNVERAQSRELTVHRSQDHFMHTFAERLQARGIKIISPTAEGRNENGNPSETVSLCYQWGELFSEADSLREESATRRCIARHETPMQTVVDRIMKESDNLNTEAVLTRLGHQTTHRRHIHSEDGLNAVRKQIEAMGLNPDDYNLADGCGLSNYNYISPQLLVAFLHYAFHRTDLFQKLYKALPVAGVDGTLENRMMKGSPAYKNVHAKTGTISGISSLSGYLQGRSGHWIAFSIMNQNQLSGRKARKMQDILCEEMVNWF